jgi:penicillin amidase
LRYLVHLEAPGWNVAGATAPWLPGVVIGHNERIAWSMTAIAADTQDLFLERTNPANPGQVWDDGRWVDMATERVAVNALGRNEPFAYDEQFTPRGVVVALDAERHLAYVLRWSGAETGGASELAALAINQADSWESFKAAVARWRMPAVEFVYADVDGHIGRLSADAEPARSGWSGELPAPAWTGRNQWRGRDDPHPIEADPPAGFVISTNGDESRAGRIREQLTSPLSIVTMSSLQRDVLALDAEALVPLLAEVDETTLTSASRQARQRLLAWDRRMTAQSGEANLFAAWRNLLIERMVRLRVPGSLATTFLTRADRARLLDAVLTPTSTWFDADVRRTRNALLGSVLIEVARRESGPAFLPAPGEVLFAHPLALTPDTRERFNVGPFHVPGGATVASLSGSSPDRMVGPSLRFVFDLRDWDQSIAILAPGQSEYPDSPHFADLAASWSRGEYFRFAYSRPAVTAAALNILRMVPSSPAGPPR